MSFQDSPAGIPTIEVVVARPQINDESNDFVGSMERVTGVAASESGARFVNFAVDGVSCESNHVRLTICLFLEGSFNHLGATDVNHNAKSARYQIIAAGGTESVSLGSHMLDTYLLRMGNVSAMTWRPNDFASDNLLLDLVSFRTINKIAGVEYGSVPVEDQGVLALVLFAVMLSVYAVNGRQVPASHRAVYVWSSVLLLTSMSGVVVVTKRNLVSEAIPFVIIVLQADVTNPGLATSESAEHVFGMGRAVVRVHHNGVCGDCRESDTSSRSHVSS